MALRATPNRLLLSGHYDEARVLIEGQLPGGSSKDVSAKVTLSAADGRIARVDADGMVRPRGDGGTVLVARLGVPRSGFRSRCTGSQSPRRRGSSRT